MDRNQTAQTAQTVSTGYPPGVGPSSIVYSLRFYTLSYILYLIYMGEILAYAL